ncbi:MAG: YeeE/YedE thiosulfate transporter family protein [Thermoguttaceae bacterium]
MAFPLTGSAGLILAVAFGFLFGLLLERGGLANYNTIVNQFRLKDFTVLKVMLTAIVVGGVGVLVLHHLNLAAYHIKPANMLGVVLGAAIFGVGIVVYGYCPGTGIAAIATGSAHALVGLFGMLAGGVAYALSFPWIDAHVLRVAALGKVRLPEVTGMSDWAWFALLTVAAVLVFVAIERIEPRR